MHMCWKFWPVIAIGITVCALLVDKPPPEEAGIVVATLRSWLAGLIVRPIAR